MRKRKTYGCESGKCGHPHIKSNRVGGGPVFTDELTFNLAADMAINPLVEELCAEGINPETLAPIESTN